MKKLIVNIRHEKEKSPYTIRDEAGQKLAVFTTIEQVDAWLKLCGGGFLSDPKDTEAGWIREVGISNWAYQQLTSQLEKAA